MENPGAARPSSSPSSPEIPTVLVIEDEASMGEMIHAVLRSRGYDVEVAPNGRLGLERVSMREPDVVILDLGLPDIDGIEVCRRLRRWYANPIIVLSADGAEDRKVAALDEGANDYVTKPFSMAELQARLRVAVRHRELIASVVDPAALRVGDVLIDTGSRTVLVAGDELELTRREFDLLTVLARNVGKVVTHKTILSRVWGPAGTTGSLRTHLAGLRKKLGEGPHRPQVETEPGVGYRMVLPG